MLVPGRHLVSLLIACGLSACSSSRSQIYKDVPNASGGQRMDVQSLLEKIIAQNDIIIRQNEQLLLLIAQCTNAKDNE